MSTQKAMARLLVQLMTTMPKEFRTVLNDIARGGDIELVREIHLARVLKHPLDQAAVLPLVLHAKDEQAATDLVREILSGGENLTDSNEAFHFSTVKHVDAVHALVRLGFDPNQFVEPDGTSAETPLSKQLARASRPSGPNLEMVPIIMAILDVIRIRDEIPLVSKSGSGKKTPAVSSDFFRSAAGASVSTGKNSIYAPVMEELAECDWPETWRLAAGRAVLDILPGRVMPQHEWGSGILARLMAKAAFSDQASLAGIFSKTNRYGYTSGAGSWLCDAALCGETAKGVVHNIVAHGLVPTDFAFDIHFKKPGVNHIFQGNLLHCAIVQKNLPMVETLLESGANLSATVERHPEQTDNPDVGRTAVGLAEAHFPEALPMLHARAAKDSIDRTLQRARKVTPGAK